MLREQLLKRKKLARQAKAEKSVRKRKNFLPTLFITALFWSLIGFIVYFVDPETIGIVPLMFVLAFFAQLFTFALLTENTRRGLLITLVTTIFLILRYFEVGNILNFALLVGVAITVEIYFTRTRY